VLQCGAVCCSAVQYVAVCDLKSIIGDGASSQRGQACCRVLLRDSVCCSVLQVCCSALQCVVVCCSVSQCVQCVAVRCSV